jgi:uncharacterized DUF497 family protein
MPVEWDEEKCRANLQKHGLSFDDAWQVLAGDTITIPDERYDYGEDRLITLGRLSGRVVVVVHVARGETTRIISMRKANAREQEIYQERLSQD